jgi:hypothetical protein
MPDDRQIGLMVKKAATQAKRRHTLYLRDSPLMSIAAHEKQRETINEFRKRERSLAFHLYWIFLENPNMKGRETLLSIINELK